MTECDWTSIGGGCGFECRVFLQGECQIASGIAEDACPEARELYREIYGE